VLLGLIFLISGLSKFTDLHAFAATMKDFGLVPDSVGNVLAVIIPSVEFISGLLLLLGLWTKLSSAMVIGLLIVFIAAMIPNIVEGNEIECGCFGPLSQSKVGVGLLLRDIVLLGMTLAVFTEEVHIYSIDNRIRGRGN
jgi:uncharacterized membrane protein YphA (DoxX/SURF4 family)